MEKLSSTIDTQIIDKTNEREDKLEAASKILSATEEIGRRLASTLEPGAKTEIRLANVSMVVMKNMRKENMVSRWETESGVKVELPVGPKKKSDLTPSEDQTVSVSFTTYNNLGNLFSDNTKGQYIRGSVLSVNILDGDDDAKEKRIHLDKPIIMTLHHPRLEDVSRRRCSYWSFKMYDWLTDGCEALSELSTLTSTVCQCTHLTNFAISEHLENAVDESTTTKTTTFAPQTRPSTRTRMQTWSSLQYYSAAPSVTESSRISSRTSVSTSVSFRRYRSFYHRSKQNNDFYQVKIVSAPPRIDISDQDDAKYEVDKKVEEVTPMLISEKTEDITERVTNFWSFSAAPQIFSTSTHSNVLIEDYEDFEDFEEPSVTEATIGNSTFKNISEAEWLNFKYSRVSRKSQPLRILVFGSSTNDTLGYYYEDESIPFLTLTVSILIPAALFCSVMGFLIGIIHKKKKKKSIQISSSIRNKSFKSDCDIFDSVSSNNSIFYEPEDIRGSFETISATDNFLTSLENE